MKAVFGVVSLLVALAIVGLVAVRQLRAVGHAPASSGVDGRVAAVPGMSGSGTVREQALQLENRIANDTIKAMNAGAAARQQESDK